MSDSPIIFISHTTSDQRDYKLAHDLADGLQSRGAKVWIAPDSIPTGSKWEPQIVSGIMEECTHFLIIISAASIKADWVLKEIRLAQERQKNAPTFVVLPLIVGRVGDYPGSDFINSFQWITYHNDLRTQIEEVTAALGLRPSLPNRFRSLIEEKTEDFVGRNFVFNAIDKFFAENTSGYFTIEGDPGVGKTAILAEFVKRRDCIAHFNVLSLGINKASQFLESVCTQLIERYSLPYPSLPPNVTQDGAFFTQLLDEASSQLQPEEVLPIAVDALDEVDLSGFPLGANILYLPPTLPRHVFMLMTRRQVALPFTTTSGQHSLNLMDFPAESREDIQAYIQQAARQPNLKAWIESRHLKDEEFINILADKSENNFMYLRYVLPEIERGVYQDLKIAQLPSGLEGYYESHWRRMGMSSNPLPRTKIKIIYILSEAVLPVSRRLIAGIIGEDELTVQEVLDDWKQFLREQNIEGERRYSIYHTSFRDFLHRREIVQAAGISVNEINSLIRKDLWRELYPLDEQ